MTLEDFKEELEKFCPTASYSVHPKTGEIIIHTGLREEDSDELIELDEVDEDFEDFDFDFDFSDSPESKDLFEED